MVEQASRESQQHFPPLLLTAMNGMSHKMQGGGGGWERKRRKGVVKIFVPFLSFPFSLPPLFFLFSIPLLSSSFPVDEIVLKSYVGRIICI